MKYYFHVKRSSVFLEPPTTHSKIKPKLKNCISKSQICTIDDFLYPGKKCVQQISNLC